jgi:pimeloyl-ACP methyl ester carboxylesterase
MIFTVIRVFITGAVILLFSACNSLTISKSTSERMVAINSDGTPALYNLKTPSGKIIKKDKYSYEQQLDSIISGIKKSGRKKIILYAFGGMNTLDSTVERTEEMSGTIYKESDYYPILINWESSLSDSYFDHLLYIRRGVKSYAYGPILAPFYLLGDLGRAAIRLPINLVLQTNGLFRDDAPGSRISSKESKKIKKLKIKYYLGKDYKKDYYSLPRSALFITLLPFRVVTTALIDVGGTSAWAVMIRRSKTVFQKTQTFETDFQDEVKALSSPPDGALSLLMDRLVKFDQENPGYEFTLIGHSMGAFITNGILFRYNMLHYKNIVYMAPACSSEDAALVLRPYLEKHPESTFYNLCIHPNMDANEMMAWGFLPRGSVLRWIDFYFTNPLNASDHCVGIWYNAMYSMPRLLGKAQGQCVIKVFGIHDPVTNTIDIDMPQDHTDFSNTKLRFWEPEFYQIPRNMNSTKKPSKYK